VNHSYCFKGLKAVKHKLQTRIILIPVAGNTVGFRKNGSVLSDVDSNIIIIAHLENPDKTMSSVIG
jgi:hypothetical protein